MPSYWPAIVIGVVGAALVAWSIVAQRGRNRAVKEASARLGLRPCPDEKAWVEETVAGIENNPGYRYEVRNPRRWPQTPPVYFYDKIRRRDGDSEPAAEQEILFPLRRAVAGAFVVAVKPSSLKAGLATRLIGAVATGRWDAQPDDLQRLDLPLDLENTNLIGVLGPHGASFYDLVDASMVSVLQGIGDAGGVFVRARGGWCVVASASAQVPFKLEELVARIRPLL
jgi:hypothetical protein